MSAALPLDIVVPPSLAIDHLLGSVAATAGTDAHGLDALDHARQGAALAEHEGAPAVVVAALLLHHAVDAAPVRWHPSLAGPAATVIGRLVPPAVTDILRHDDTFRCFHDLATRAQMLTPPLAHYRDLLREVLEVPPHAGHPADAPPTGI